MRTLMSFIAFLSVFSLSIAYADNFHIKNYFKENIIATVYLDGKKQGDFTLKPGQDYHHVFWHNLSVKVKLTNTLTRQTCSLSMDEKHYPQSGKYEPEVTQGTPNCRYYSSFDQINWYVHRSEEAQDFSTVYIWGPWH